MKSLRKRKEKKKLLLELTPDCQEVQAALGAEDGRRGRDEGRLQGV